MYVNLSSLAVEATASGFVRLYLGNDALDADRAAKGYARTSMCVTLTAKEAFYAVLGAHGLSSFNPYFDDGIYLLKVATDGAKLLHRDGGVSRHVYASDPPEYEQGDFLKTYYFTFPAHECTHILLQAANMADRLKADADAHRKACEDPNVPYWMRPKWDYAISERTWSHSFHPDTLAHWRRAYAPRIRFEFHGDAKESYLAALHDPRVQPRENYTVKDQFHSIARIARNASNGQVYTIHVSPDDHQPLTERPRSFYWWIEHPDGHRYMNGGIIAHDIRAKNAEECELWGLQWPGDDADWRERPIVAYEYSTHT